MQYQEKDFTQFIVTGFYAYSTKRFRSIYTNARQAMGINLWRGKVYGVLVSTGKKVLLKSVFN